MKIGMPKPAWLYGAIQKSIINCIRLYGAMQPYKFRHLNFHSDTFLVLIVCSFERDLTNWSNGS